MSQRSKAIRILSRVFKAGLESSGFDADILIVDELDELPKTDDLFFVFTPHKFHQFKRSAFSKKAEFVMYQQEQLSFRTEEGKFRIDQLHGFIDQYDRIVDVSRDNLPVYERFGRRVDFILPTAYHELFEFNLDVQPVYDCVFFGRYDDKPRRREVIGPLMEEFRFYPRFSGLYGDDLGSAIAESRIVLNIHQGDLDFPEWLRLMLAISNKRLLVSEPIGDITPLRVGEHIVVASKTDLSATIRFYLSDSDSYARITEAAYEFVKANYRMDVLLSQLALKLFQ